MRKIIFLSLLLIISSFSVLAQSRYGGVLSYCESTLPRTFDPITGEDDLPNVRLCTLLYEGLFSLNIDREPVEKLASGYKMSVDNSQIIIDLKDNVKWSDGGSFTSADVVATVRAIQASDNQYLLSLIKIFKDVEAVNKYSVLFKFNGRYPLDFVLKHLVFNILPAYKLKNLPLTNKSDIARDPVGTGFFKYASRGPNYINLLVSQDYRDRNPGKGPYLNGVNILEQIDAGSQIEYLKANYVQLLLSIPPTEIAPLQEAGYNIIRYNTYTYNFIAYNFKNKILAVRNIRQAMMYGFNRANILSKVYLNQGQLISGPFPSGAAYYSPDVKPYPYNPSKAVALLRDAGFTIVNSNGIRENAAGDLLQFNLVLPRYSSDDFVPRVINQFITDMKTIGIKIIRKDYEFENYLHKVKYDHDFDLAYAQLVFSDPGNIYQLFYSKNNEPGHDNFISYNNSYVDTLLQQMKATGNEIVKKNLGQKLHIYLHDDLPYMFLWSLDQNAAASMNLRNIRPYITPFTFFGEINKWYLAK